MTGTVGTALQAAAQALRAAGIESAPLEARLLLGEVMQVAAPALVAHPERSLTAAQSERFHALVGQRASRRPLSHLLGRREFWSLTFRVTADTLDPRPDSETVVAAALAKVADRAAALRLLDLGTGTGCLLLALLHELPQATGLGVDCSAPALAVAQGNAAALGLAGRAAFRCGKWGEGLHEVFDVIVGNPPYVRAADIDGLMPEVARHEPRLALDGGADGLDAYRAIASGVAGLLRPAGFMALEVGAGQSDSVARIFAAGGLRVTSMRRDLAGQPRCLVLRWNRTVF